MSTELKIPSGGILVRIMPADSSPPPPPDISPPLAQSLPPTDVTPQLRPVTTRVLKKIKEAGVNRISPDDDDINIKPFLPTDDTWIYDDEQHKNATNWKNYKPSSGRPMDPNKMKNIVGKYTYFDMTSYGGRRRSSSRRKNYKKSVRRVKSAKRASRSRSRKYRNRK